MKLYDGCGAPNPRRVRWFMAEKGVDDIEIVDMDILGGDLKSGDYVARAGVAVVPALTMDDGTTITESVAICRYLEAIYPEPNMFGRTPEETAVIEMWTRRAEMMAALPLMMSVRHSHPAMAVLETPVPQVAAYNRAQGEKALALFDARLGISPFIGADRVTIADGVLFLGIEFTRLVRFKPSEALQNLNRWLGVMRNRPSAKAGL